MHIMHALLKMRAGAMANVIKMPAQYCSGCKLWHLYKFWKCIYI